MGLPFPLNDRVMSFKNYEKYIQLILTEFHRYHVQPPCCEHPDGGCVMSSVCNSTTLISFLVFRSLKCFNIYHLVDQYV